MIHLVLALLKGFVKKLTNFISKIESRLKSMETEVKSDLAGLTKFATLKSLSIDQNGNYTVTVGYQYKDPAGNILQYADESKSIETIAGTVPDPSIAADQLTAEQLQAQKTSSFITAALTPVLSALIPGA